MILWELSYLDCYWNVAGHVVTYVLWARYVLLVLQSPDHSVVDPVKCNLCGKCEIDCLVRIPIRDYVTNNNGLVTNAECLLCGKCIESCKPKALNLKFVWNRNKYIQNYASTSSAQKAMDY